MSKGYGKGRSPTRFSYTYENIAEILGCSVQAARKHAQRGNFDPKNLLSVLEFIKTRLQDIPLEESSDSAALIERIEKKQS